MIPEASFLFSIAGLNASLAGLGGLLVALRRGPGLGPLEALRLRQVVEFAFANLVLAISVPPAVQLLGMEQALRLSGLLALVYNVVALPVLHTRVARVGIRWGRHWATAAIGLTALGVALAAATAIRPSAGLYELLLVAMLARPMVAFLLVLATIDAPDESVQART